MTPANRTRAARDARGLWGVITHAVRVTSIYEERTKDCSAVSTEHDDRPLLRTIDERCNRADMLTRGELTDTTSALSATKA